jgi:DNA-binding SARP family transcriptional activator/Flp pilus assembly protein TadD
VDASVVAGVETRTESNAGPALPVSLEVRMLGPMTIGRHGAKLALPASRKVRALLAYLALAPKPVPRSQLCELLWDVPNDPRGELRWCLSKMRGVVDEPERRRVLVDEDKVALDLSDCRVDAIELGRAAEHGFEGVEFAHREHLATLFGGDFLEGLEIDRSPAFSAWLTGQRRRFRSLHAALLEDLVASVPDDLAFGYLEKWLQLAPFDRRVHESLLAALVRQGRLREAEEHLAATVRQFEAEGLDCGPLHHALRAARARLRDAPRDDVEPALVIPAAGADAVAATTPHRASIAVMPFADPSAANGARGGIGDALAHDVITRLAKLRSLLVIAQGTVFALHERGVGPEEAGRMLNVDYTVGGSIRREARRLIVAVELAETRTARVVWADVFREDLDDAFTVLDAIGDRIVAAVAHEIEALERNRAILKPPSSLDAWEAHHRGLWHMYRFSKDDNERARRFFETAVRLDPTFARAYAGLSFTHWQNAFQNWGERDTEVDRAFAAAGQALMVDDRDPAAHWAMGRALWLRGRRDESVTELEQAVDLSPSFALGHYALAFVNSQAGNAEAAIAAADHSRELSPFDPLLFGILGARAMALVRLGRFQEAAEAAAKAAARPNAHVHIHAIAALSLALAGATEQARSHAAAVHRAVPGYTLADFFSAFRFDAAGEALFRDGARRVGMSQA